MLIMHGTADKIVNIDGSKLLFDRACSTDKTLKVGCHSKLSTHTLTRAAVRWLVPRAVARAA